VRVFGAAAGTHRKKVGDQGPRVGMPMGKEEIIAHQDKEKSKKFKGGEKKKKAN